MHLRLYLNQNNFQNIIMVDVAFFCQLTYSEKKQSKIVIG